MVQQRPPLSISYEPKKCEPLAPRISPIELPPFATLQRKAGNRMTIDLDE